MKQRLIVIFTLGAIGAICALVLNPVNSMALKLAFLGSCFLAWAGSLVIVWQWRPVRVCLFALPIVLTIPFLLPTRELDTDELRKDFVHRMVNYEGTRYYWGGRNPAGLHSYPVLNKRMDSMVAKTPTVRQM